MIRFRSGTSLLNKVVKQFDRAVADLELAHEQIISQANAAFLAADAATDRNIEREAKVRALVRKIQDKVNDLLYRFKAWHDEHNAIVEDRMFAKVSELRAAAARAELVRSNIAKLVGAA